MEKIISLFARNYLGDYKVRDEIVPGAEWVQSGEGVATRKYDGTCCLVQGGKLYKRRGTGWTPVTGAAEDCWHREADLPEDDGTYELCGPKVQGNPEGFHEHTLVRHGATVLYDVPRDYRGLRKYLATAGIEGIVWHHPDGRMVKIKARDFPTANAKQEEE